MPITRDLVRLASTEFDVLVVGAGVYGLTAAYDAAQRGMQVAVIDRSDFGSGISFNHQKTALGGLRLQSFGLGRARESIVERRALARMAPHLVRPLIFLAGTYRATNRRRRLIDLGFRVERWVGRDRNEGLPPALRLPGGTTISRGACLKLFPGIPQDGLTGGAMWYDYLMVAADRLTLAFGLAAAARGACLANYVEATGPIKDGTRVVGVRARDAQSGDRFEIRAKLTIIAAGSQTGVFAAACGVKRSYPLLKAMNVLTTRAVGEIAVGASTPAGRMLTMVPWRDRALIGTSQSHRLVQPDDTGVTDEELDAFIAEINAAYPVLKLRRDEVRLVHRGLVPAEMRKGRPELRRQSEVQDHTRDGVDGAISIVGVKYTTARAAAEKAINLAQRKLGLRKTRSQTGTTPLPGAEDADTETIARDVARARGLRLDDSLVCHLAGIHGVGATDLVELIAENPALSTRVRSDDPTIGAEIVHAARHEMALTLVDAVVRRTALGAAGHPGAEPADACARLLQHELGWSDARRLEELTALDRFYLPVGPLGR